MPESLLSHAGREASVHILSLDPLLVADVQERVHYDPRMRDIAIVTPPVDPERSIPLGDLEAIAKGTVTARVLVLDVRSQTLPRVQHAFNRVIGYNRLDLNETCFTLLIGDGPLNLFHPGTTLEVFAPLLVKLRLDYSPAAFFYDPFLHYAHAERQALKLRQRHVVSREVPARLAKAFRGMDVDLSAIRQHFCAAAVSEKKKEKAKAKRLQKLKAFFERRIDKLFPDDKGEMKTWLSKAGHEIEGETLRLHLYPLHFEDWVYDLLTVGR